MATWDPRANDLFLEALALRSATERRRFLERACAGDASFRAQVESLLEASERAGSFLERPAAGLVGTVDELPTTERSGTALGPYKLIEYDRASHFLVIARNNGNINNLRIVHRSPDFFDMILDIEVADAKHLADITAALRATPAVSTVERARG